MEKNKLIFEKCMVKYGNEPFTGEFELKKGKNLLVGYVSKGILMYEEEFFQNKLLMKKKYDECEKGYQIIYDTLGKILSEGNILNGKKTGPWKTYIGDSIYFSNY